MTRRHYSQEFKTEAINLLEASGCNLNSTSARTGVPKDTLRRWWHEHQQRLALAEAETSSIDALRQELIQNALRLARQLKDANGSVTFNQRATALNQLVDKVIRLMDKLPEEDYIEMMRLPYDVDEEDEADEADEADQTQ